MPPELSIRSHKNNQISKHNEFFRKPLWRLEYENFPRKVIKIDARMCILLKAPEQKKKFLLQKKNSLTFHYCLLYTQAREQLQSAVI